MRADADASFNETRTIPPAKQLLRLFFHLFFFAGDERDDIAENVERRDSRITRTGDGLHGDDKDFFQAEGIRERFENENKSCCRAIGIGNNEARTVTAIFLLNRNRVQMRRVYFWNQKGNVRRHSMVFGVADDGITGACELFLCRTRDGRIERGKNEIAIKRRFQTLHY